MEETPRVLVAGAGLAGCEAAWALAEEGIPVLLADSKPGRMSPAHRSANFGELVCSNSLKAARLDAPPACSRRKCGGWAPSAWRWPRTAPCPPGGALAVDRERFSAGITRRLRAHPLIRVEERELTELPGEGAAVIATGPLTLDTLAARLKERCGGALSFFDAAAPIVTAESVDGERAFRASRYGREESGEGDYLNCPLNREEYEAFHAALVTAETAPLHEFDRQGEGLRGLYAH